MTLDPEGSRKTALGTFDGRVALVTGASNGIGRATARALAAAGAQVIVADVEFEAGENTACTLRAEGGAAQFIACDVSEPEQVRALLERTIATFGHLDVLINNAGISGGAQRLHELEIGDWDRVMAVNLRGPFLCAKYALPHLMKRRGVMVNVASTYGLIGAPQAPAYCTSKGGVVNLTRQLAVDYGPSGVRVNAVCPGYVDTDMGGQRSRLTPQQAAAALERRESNAARQPLGRQAQVDEVARVVVFLASEASSFMTGSIVTVDGGCTSTFNYNQ